MSRGQMKDRKLVFWKDNIGFMKEIGVYTMKSDEAQIYKNSSEIRNAQKAFKFLKIENMKVIEFPEIKDHKRKAKND